MLTGGGGGKICQYLADVIWGVWQGGGEGLIRQGEGRV